jgi:hypothetical protein
MAIPAVRNSKQTIAVLLMHGLVLLACFLIVLKANLWSRAQEKPKASLDWLQQSGILMWVATVILSGIFFLPLLLYILASTHISLFGSVWHHAGLGLAAVVASKTVLPWLYGAVLWPAVLQLVSAPRAKTS